MYTEVENDRKRLHRHFSGILPNRQPAQDMVTAVRQIETIEWWTVHSPHFELFSSDVGIEEANQGNREAAHRRIEVLREMTILTVTLDASSLARALLSEGVVPEVAEVDALHIAVAAVNGIDYILTWNFRHMANSVRMPLIADICEEQGYKSPIITTPNQLEGGVDIGR